MKAYNAITVYGDSVTGQTPVMVRNSQTEQVHIVEIQNLENLIDNPQWVDYLGFKLIDGN